MNKTLLGVATIVVAAGVFAAAQQGGQRQAPDPRSMGGGDCAQNPYNCKDTANPLPKVDTVWLEEMTWMDVRDAMAAGKTTVIIPTGGFEPNGPWLALGKHNYVLHANCEAIARKMGNALCAPVIKHVPEGDIDPPTGHMTTPGTISLREDTFRALLTDTASSLKQAGFKQIFFIGDSGGNQAGQRAVAEALNAKWAGKASINGVDVSNKAKNTAWAKQIVAFRAEKTVEAINKAIANKGTLPAQPRRTAGH
jgi:creatinine amidohydrolase/Fe(II)-dependent formamide hydrolase-like protein